MVQELSNNDYRVATLTKSYLIVKGIKMQSLHIDLQDNSALIKLSVTDVWKDRRTDLSCGKASILKGEAH